MNKIRFSHNYPKLWKQTEAKLLEIRIIDFKDITKELIEYDTKTEEGEYFELKGNKFLQLIFLGNKGIPFCTIRRHTPEKFDYYYACLRNQFEVKIKGQ